MDKNKGSVDSPASTGASAARPKRADWELIERDYRAGVKSIRELGKDYGVSDTAIRKRAMTYAWTRDLSVKVQQRVRTKLVREKPNREPRELSPETEEQIVEETATEVAGVIRGHRQRAAHQIELVDLLTKQLVDVAGNRGDFEDALDEMTAEDKSPERYNRLMKAIALPTHAVTANNLANALKTLIGLQRQAYSIKDESEAPASALGDLLKQVSGTALPIVKDDADE